MEKKFLETLAKGNRKKSFRAEIGEDYIDIHTGAKNSSARFTKVLIEDCLDYFSDNDWFILGNAIDGVKPGGLGDYFKNTLKMSPKYASHFASLMVELGRLKYRYGPHNRLEFRVKDSRLKPAICEKEHPEPKREERVLQPMIDTIQGPYFNLRFPVKEMQYWASRYQYADDGVAYEVGESAKEKGYLNKEEFLSICYWKTPRSRSKCERNSEKQVEEYTRQALSVSNEELRIGTLTLLHGVSWPTASVILHFCHKDDYPILDFRALWSIGFDRQPSFYDFSLWRDYTIYCRDIASAAGVDMRILDRALWQYSKERQSGLR